MKTHTYLTLAAATLLLAACGGGGGSAEAVAVPAPAPTPAPAPAPAPSAAPAPSPSAPAESLAAQVGDKIFHDTNLSGSGKIACSTCHDDNNAYAPTNSLSVQPGGIDLAASGTRAVPSLTYKDDTPAYADLLSNPDGISVPGPGGGFMWDGRADTLAAQAQFPLLAANEMANASPAAIVATIQAAGYAPLFLQAYGSTAFTDPNAAFQNVLNALQAYQLEDPSFHPYTSKFDLYAANKIGGALTAAESRGLQVFNDPTTGNCNSCHYMGAGFNGSSAQFTDFSYEAIGVPRNPAIPANADPTYYDIGICGPLRADHTAAADSIYCGMFKTPTLRNVATRQSFFHNGVMHSLEQVIRFYNTRDTNPEIWYPTVGGTPMATPDPSFPTYGLITTEYTGGTVQKFNDLPPQYVANIDKQLPLDGRPVHSAPPMTEQNIADLICFLNTLTDGYVPPANPPTSGPCVQ